MIEWIPLIAASALGLIGLLDAAVRTAQLRMIVVSTIRSLPSGTDDIDVQIHQQRGPRMRVRARRHLPEADGT